MSEFLEIGMIVLFGISWPMDIIKSIKTKTTEGKSILFLIIVFIGYISGVVSKLISPSFKWYTMFFYILNMTMVGIDISLYIINRRNEKLKSMNSV